MTLPRVRFTVRRMMVAVAIVASLFGAGRVWSQWTGYRRAAELHGHIAVCLRRPEPKLFEPDFGNCCGPSGSDRVLMADYHERLRRKYESAMWTFWRLVPPDPPPPWPRSNPKLVRSEALRVDEIEVLKRILRPKETALPPINSETPEL